MRHEYTIVHPEMVIPKYNLGTILASRNSNLDLQPCCNLTGEPPWKMRSGMVRFALALAAIVILTLSAGLTRGQPQATPLSVGATSAAAFHNNTDTSFRADLMLMNRAALLRTPQRSAHEEPPAPALLVYLALILVGSAGSVALARRRLQGES
jgi:hypothetical protein